MNNPTKGMPKHNSPTRGICDKWIRKRLKRDVEKKMTEKCNLKLERLALAMLGMKKIMTRNMLLKMNWKKQE